MSYTPTEWKSGDIVTSEKLNKLETGVAGASGASSGPIIVTAAPDQMMAAMVLDKTWQEISDAGCGFIILDLGAEGGAGVTIMPITAITDGNTPAGYAVFAAYNMDPVNIEWMGIKFSAASASDHPSYAQPEQET